MACSLCGSPDHNVRTCPGKAQRQIEERDYTYWVKIDNLTEEESRNLGKEMIDVKQKIAPDGRATAARAHKKDLPEQVRKALAIEGGNTVE